MAIACARPPCRSPALGWLMRSSSVCRWQPGWAPRQCVCAGGKLLPFEKSERDPRDLASLLF